MQLKNIDSLSITECCRQLNIRKQDLPAALKSISADSDVNGVVIKRLESLIKADKDAFTSCSTIKQYENYLKSWKDGLFQNKARQKVTELSHIADETAFYKANRDSTSGCKEYLKKYPTGRFVKDAKSILTQKKKIKKTRTIIIFVLILIATGLFAYSNYVRVTYITVDNNVELDNLGSEIKLNMSTDAISSTITATSSEDWIDCRVFEKDLYISANTNPKGKRNATISIIANSSFFGHKLPNRKQTTIIVSQKTGYATHLSLSNDHIHLTANGEKSSIPIDTDGVFTVSTAPEWLETSVTGKTLNLNCEENAGIVRDGFIVIKSGTKSLRLYITQAGKSATHFDVSTSDVKFSIAGGCGTVEVYTDGEWRISTETKPWVHTNINGNTITLRVDANNGEPKTDYFVIETGSLEKRINISQEGLATYLSLSESSIEASRSGTGYKKCYVVNVYTDGKNVTASTSANWIDVNVVGGDQIEIKTSENTDRRRTATITVNADQQSKTIRVTQKGISNCMKCYNWQYGYSTGQVWGIIYYDYAGFPQYGWAKCTACDGSGSIED